MLNSKLASLLTDLSETEYVTSKQLAEKSETSDRTVQTRIRDLREELEKHGATITSRQRYGYLLAVKDREQYEAWLAGERNRLKTALPNFPIVRKRLEQGSVEFLYSYYREELFFPHIGGTTRDEVIREICHRMAQAYPIPEQAFCESVLSRERMGGTDFGNQVAIPHPEDCMVTENVVCVGILERPVLWSSNTVQLVVLSAIYESTSMQTQKFYQMTSALLSDPIRVKRIISRRNYAHFMKLLLE